MEAENFVNQLTANVSKGWTHNEDFYEFLNGLLHLTQKIEMIKKAQNPYIPIAKHWLSAFQIISKNTDISTEMQLYMSSLCSAVTMGFLHLAKSISRYDRKYTHELYCHWKLFLSYMTTSRRSASFIRYGVELNEVFIKALKTAKNRCEQLSILSVLTLYTVKVPPAKLPQLLRNTKILFDDDNLINILIRLGPNPSTTGQHTFLQALNALGTRIITFNPKKIECEKLDFHFTVSAFEMWADFNLKDQSLMFTAVSKITDVCHFIGIVTLPELIEYVNTLEEYMLTVKGRWNLLEAGAKDIISEVVSIKVLLPIEARNMIWKQNVRSFFKVLPKTNPIHPQEQKSDSNRKMLKKRRRFSKMLVEPITSYSSSDFEVQPKRFRQCESSTSYTNEIGNNAANKIWDDVFDRLKYSN